MFPGLHPKDQFSVLLSAVDASLEKWNITGDCRLRH